MNRARSWLALVVALGLLAGSAAPLAADPLPPLRRVNAPYFPGGVLFKQSAIFWFGQAAPYTDYADVRVGYDDNQIQVHVALFDRLLWRNDNPASDALTNYDSVSLYFNKAGAAGNTLDQAYRFDGQVSWDWETRSTRQAEYYGSGSSWIITATTPFTTESTPSFETDTVGGFNNGENNRGWFITYHIPYSSLGLTRHPDPGTLWGLALVVHNRDYAPPAPMQPDELWPETAIVSTPSTWGQLYFGQPAYTPPSASPGGTVTIRNGLNGTVVTEAMPGGGTQCGDPLDLNTYWTVWGTRVITSTYYFNVQNQFQLADWPCYSKYFTTFPLASVPPNKVVISASLSMNQFGNAGDPNIAPAPVPSYIQVLTVGQDWTPNLLTWNNAPLARENVAMTEVDPLNGAPAVFRTWDVSRAVAEAYGAGQPLRLAVYSADWDYHSGRYFRPSSYPDEQFRPTLTVVWGETTGTVNASVWPVTVSSGQLMTYSLSLLGAGTALTLTDGLPVQVSPPGPIQLVGGGTVTNAAGSRQILWNGAPAAGQPVTLTFPVTAVVPGPVAVYNTAVLTDAAGHVTTAVAMALVDPLHVALPLVVH